MPQVPTASGNNLPPVSTETSCSLLRSCPLVDPSAPVINLVFQIKTSIRVCGHLLMLCSAGKSFPCLVLNMSLQLSSGLKVLQNPTSREWTGLKTS